MAEAGTPKAAACPICGKPVGAKYRPFCSTRCQQIDLGRWLGENYRIAAENDPSTARTGPGEDPED